MFKLGLKISPLKSSNCDIFTKVHDCRCCVLMKNDIFGFNIIFLCCEPVIIHYHSQKQKLHVLKHYFSKYMQVYLTANFLLFSFRVWLIVFFTQQSLDLWAFIRLLFLM